ncbi:extracellular solute-binding protein [Cohnella sp. GbtcB17]|uniref:extracellular solute-binding protein n=1 Tax=Cohnella sp. GbtcB17 TaxID=2824762 RepID=UPI001C2F38E7|nr:extracellular solute-binding protein [Cohnella sp. GbtcB17]
MKKMLTVGLLASMAVSMAACASNNNNNTASPSASGASPSASASASASQPSSSAVPSDASKKISISAIEGTWLSPVPADTGGGLKKINEKFNVEYKPQFVPYEEYSSKLPVVMAAGDLPDVIGIEAVDSNFVKWAKQGAFLPLNDYIDKYPTLKAVPKNVWDAVTVEGKIYAIPQYFPSKYGKKPIIRKDWLDNLGLAMPTTYEELEKVAIAFTKDDPDKNGKDDTYGFALSKQIVYGASMGAAWDIGWYNKNAEGQLIPGIISDGYKEQTQFLANLYKAGALHKDWAVSKSTDVGKDFFAGKYGIWYEQAYSMGGDQFKTLKELSPTAEVVVIPPFKQADGQQGFTAGQGYYIVTALNAKMKGDEDKINRILQMQDYFRTYIPFDQRGPQNPDYDWQNGGENVAYKMVDGLPVAIPEGADERPGRYHKVAQWAETDEATEPYKTYADPTARAFAQASVDLLKNTKFYVDPVYRIHSEVLAQKGSELEQIAKEWQTKMIVGQEPIASWDKMVEEYMKKGGKELIDEVNKLLADAGIQGEWK